MKTGGKNSLNHIIPREVSLSNFQEESINPNEDNVMIASSP